MEVWRRRASSNGDSTGGIFALRTWSNVWTRGSSTGETGRIDVGQRDRLHGSVSICLPVPAVKGLEELNECPDFDIGKHRSRDGLRWNGGCKGARRLTPTEERGALPHTPASLMLRFARFARPGNIRGGRWQKAWNWWASRWLSASRRWRCRPSQPRTGLANRLPGFWFDRTPLAHVNVQIPHWDFRVEFIRPNALEHITVVKHNSNVA